MDDLPKVIGELQFHDVQVRVYYDIYMDKNKLQCSWQMRNPLTCYEGYMYMDNEGKITYPEDAVIPEQVDRDREILPKFIIVGQPELDVKIIARIKSYLDADYLRYNMKYVKSLEKISDNQNQIPGFAI